MNSDTLRKFARYWRWSVFTRDCLFALCVGGGVLVVAEFFLLPAWLDGWAAAGSAGALVVLLAVSRPWQIDAARIAGHLDRTYPEMEESGALFLRAPEGLTLLERLQLRRVEAAVAPRVSRRLDAGTFGLPPRRFFGPALVCMAALLPAIAGAEWWRRLHPAGGIHAPPVDHAAVPGPATPPPAAPAWPRLVGGGLLVTPPTYTGRAPRRVDGFDAEVEEGATVAWTVALDRPVSEARLVFGEGTAGAAQALEVRPVAGGVELTATRRVTAPGLYSLAATLPDGAAWNPPELHALKVLPDRPPLVRVVLPAAARTELAPTAPPAAPPHLDVEVQASDDYALADIRLVATVAKGSGEAVKFREIPLAFDADTPAPDDARARRFTRRLDLGALGMEGGDELYFFVQAYDNRQPVANRTRSETRFVTLRGPQEKATTVGKGMTGINLVPQYFRSQRQIILDTEKLLAERATIPEETFRERADGLGVDQQLLRLRYGQLLGEEMEGGNGDHAEISLDPLERAVPEQPAGPRAAASITQRFLQEHEAQDRQGGTEDERAAGLRPEHPDAPLTPGQIVAPFVDEHDSREKATYYDPGATGTMRDALAAMWDAEKYLRTARPQEALAPEHRALEILKDLQQTARAYVQHVGFEAPPIKVAQRRLTGDAGDAPSRGSVPDVLPPADPAAVAARTALAGLPWDGGGALDAEEVAALRQAEPALTAAATRQPEVFLAGLQTLRRAVAGEVVADQAALRRALLRLLPPARPLPGRAAEGDPALAGEYFRALSINPEEKNP